MIVLVPTLMGKLNDFNVLSTSVHFFLLFLRMVALMSPEDSWVAKWQRISELDKVIAL